MGTFSLFCTCVCYTFISSTFENMPKATQQQLEAAKKRPKDYIWVDINAADSGGDAWYCCEHVRGGGWSGFELYPLSELYDVAENSVLSCCTCDKGHDLGLSDTAILRRLLPPCADGAAALKIRTLLDKLVKEYVFCCFLLLLSVTPSIQRKEEAAKQREKREREQQRRNKKIQKKEQKYQDLTVAMKAAVERAPKVPTVLRNHQFAIADLNGALFFYSHLSSRKFSPLIHRLLTDALKNNPPPSEGKEPWKREQLKLQPIPTAPSLPSPPAL